MPMTGTPTNGGDNTVTISPSGFFQVDGQGGNDLLVVNYASLAIDIEYRDAGYGWMQFTDDFGNAATFINFERYDLTGGSGSDTLVGGDQSDAFHGNGGADIIRSGLGADVIDGGSGQDRWVASYGSVADNIAVTLLASGVSAVAATGASVSGIERITITTSIGADVIDTLQVTGDDSVSTGSGDDVFRSAGGKDSYNGGDGSDRLVLDYSDASTSIDYSDQGYGWWRVGDGTQWTTYINVESFDITGGNGSDTLWGWNLDDHLTGNGGDDYLDGGQGADTIAGGSGTDTWKLNVSDRTEDTVVDLTTQTTNYGAAISGIEALNYTGGEAADVVTADRGAYNDVFSTGGGDDTITSGRGRDSVNGGSGNDLLVMDWSAIADPAFGIANTDQGYGVWRFSSASGDLLDYANIEQFELTGGAGNDNLAGGGDYDWLSGLGGNDTLNSGTGDATIDGGAGNDRWTANLGAENESVRVNLLDSQTAAQAKLSGSNVRNIEMLSLTTGAAGDVISAAGYAFNDTVNSGGGNDTVNGGLGRDSLNGGDGGADKLVADWSSITDSSNGVGHSDIGYGWWRFATADEQNLTDYINFEQFDLTGGAGADTLAGRDLYDWLRGNGGNDTLNSGRGDALIDGGLGDDRWTADLGSETKAVKFDALASQTTAQAALSGSAVTGIEMVSLTTGIGADVIVTQGYAFDDSVNSGGGNDTASLGLGRDGFNGGDGTDLLVIDYSDLTGDIGRSDIGYGWLRYQDRGGTVSTDYINVERFNITGGSGDDSLIGGSLNDTLKGGTGNDVLNGGRGVDTIAGGAGSDTWVADYTGAPASLSLTTTAGGNGTLLGNGTAISGIENIQLTTGDFADTVNLAAQSGNDIINSNGGNDTVNVGQGRYDTANGGNGNDLLIASAALSTGGIKLSDAGYGWLRYSSNAGDYTLDFINFEAINMTGSARGDKLAGLGGADLLSGGNGADRLDGGAGSDTLTGGAGADQFYFNAPWSAGVDTITDAASGDFIRLAGVAVSSIVSGSGGALLAGEASFSTAGGVTSIFVGLDGTAGADFQVQLTGSFGPGALAAVSGDIVIL